VGLKGAQQVAYGTSETIETPAPDGVERPQVRIAEQSVDLRFLGAGDAFVDVLVIDS
jgi:hypothetical protein